MRAFLGRTLGIAVLLLCMLVALLAIGGVGGLIWGCRIFHGPRPSHDPATLFFVIALVLIIPVVGHFAGSWFVLPIFAAFDVRVFHRAMPLANRRTLAVARSVRAVAFRYVELMDKVIEQGKLQLGDGAKGS